MIKRFIGWFILIPICAILIIFALANRQVVALHFDPTSTLNPIFANIELPLFIIIYAMLFIGVIFGGIAVWFTQGKFRKECRTLSKKTTSLEIKVEELKKSARDKINEKSLLSAKDLMNDEI